MVYPHLHSAETRPTSPASRETKRKNMLKASPEERSIFTIEARRIYRGSWWCCAVAQDEDLSSRLRKLSKGKCSRVWIEICMNGWHASSKDPTDRGVLDCSIFAVVRVWEKNGKWQLRVTSSSQRESATCEPGILVCENVTQQPLSEHNSYVFAEVALV